MARLRIERSDESVSIRFLVPLNQLPTAYSKLWPDAHCLLIRIVREDLFGDDVVRDLNHWLDRFLVFIRDESDTSYTAEDRLKIVVSLRTLALTFIPLAKKRGVQVPENVVLEIAALPGKFNFKIGKRDDFEFHTDWFSWYIENWSKDLKHLMNRKNNRILEVGSFEGFSACWILEHLVHGPNSSLTCVDTFEDSFFKVFRANIAKTGKRSKVKIKNSHSRDVLGKFPAEYFDFIYLDGSHRGADVLEDAVLAWPLLKSGGILTFDDYLLEEHSQVSVREAVDFFLRCYSAQIEPVRKDVQVSVRKRSGATTSRST
jgi:predicted O-methyltransferase YrrM